MPTFSLPAMAKATTTATITVAPARIHASWSILIQLHLHQRRLPPARARKANATVRRRQTKVTKNKEVAKRQQGASLRLVDSERLHGNRLLMKIVSGNNIQL